ncbi:Receptor-like protein 12 [Acorus calamus]|uniref:Receptor-like protein 12 n=1 Tax=Acorus calamus TaxID=4465 RepID=A0AAV9E6T0_ACOCL|nr:Receptor-like protein 12 [Acorus calamus]
MASSHTSLLLLFICITATHSCLSARANRTAPCVNHERTTLLGFQRSAHGSSMLSLWSGTNCCAWNGVTCDKMTGHIVGLNLKGLSEVPPSLLSFTHLTHLDLSSNDFRLNPIPEFIGALQGLTYLNISEARFGGPIPPHLGNLTSLQVLDMSHNTLTGQIPTAKLRLEHEQHNRVNGGLSRVRHE